VRFRIPMRDESLSIALLRWSLALVLGGQAFVVLLHILGGDGEHPPAHHRLGQAPLYVCIAGLELLGSILLLAPPTRLAGGVAVLASLAGATAVSVSEGANPPLSFLVYAFALFVVLQHRPARADLSAR
jgi:hypothetical protein